jgi:hypothetical protein
MAQPTFHLASRRREGAQRKAGERSRAPGALAAVAFVARPCDELATLSALTVGSEHRTSAPIALG